MSCGPEGDQPQAAALEVSPKEVTLDPQGGQEFLTVSSSEDWLMRADAKWIKVATSSGKASADPIKASFTYEANTDGAARSAVIIVKTLKGKTAEEICFQDFKQFTVNDVRFGVGQINSMNVDELSEIKEKLLPYMEKAALRQKLDMVFFMLTNIVDESTELLCYGKNAKEQMIAAFDLPSDVEDVILHGVVSRKKQLIPTFVVSLQQ